MMIGLKVQLFCLLFFCPLSPLTALSAPAPAPTIVQYTMEDLEILESEKNYTEFFNHARDLRPSLRNQHWKEMVSNMAESYLDKQLEKNTIDQKVFSFTEELFSWPLLKKNDFFIYKREKIALIFFEKSLKKLSVMASLSKTSLERVNLLKLMMQFWKKNPTNPNFGLKLAEMSHDFNHDQIINIWDFLKPITTGPFALPFCTKKFIQKKLFLQLEKILNTTSEDKKTLNVISQHMSQDCWRSLAVELKSAIFTTSGQTQYNIYRLLELYGELSLEAQDFYHGLYILNAPVKGKTFNKAWNTIKMLGPNYKRRMQVLQRLKSIDPLPDTLFSLKDRNKKIIIIDHIAKNFPEYIDFYRKSCLDFLTGRKVFPNGNPTLHCSDLFDTKDSQKWLGKQNVEIYKKILNSNDITEKAL